MCAGLPQPLEGKRACIVVQAYNNYIAFGHSVQVFICSLGSLLEVKCLHISKGFLFWSVSFAWS